MLRPFCSHAYNFLKESQGSLTLACRIFTVSKMSEPPAKKPKTVNEALGKGSSDGPSVEEFLKSIQENREKAGSSIDDFKFNKKRVQVLSKEKVVPENAKGILYWMTRDQRVQDNWSLLYAQRLALKLEIPLHVCFCLRPKFLDATIRHFKFMLKGLEEVAKECKKLDIEFHLLLGEGEKLISEFVKNNGMGAVIIDFSPLRGAQSWVKALKAKLPDDIPLMQVDAHNIVPLWVASEKAEYAARTIRNKINSKLGEYLTNFPPVIKHPHQAKNKAKEIDWAAAEATLEVDRSVDAVDWATPGYTGGMKVLYDFCHKRLKNFATLRNDPTKKALSDLSPWFHFGQISIQRCILVVKTFKSHSESVAAFCEEAIVRRELADNFCFYNPNYDNIEGAYAWAKTTLKDHKSDKRDYLYTREELEEGRTHDDLWNSAQIQMVKEGKMHGFLRMYWAKKILEWTETPEQALEFAIYLNDRFNLDGRDPNGYVGCMWSICGTHDQGWRERKVFGKIRYMNYEGCKRKFNVSAFVARYGGKVHKKAKK